eukprot:TRINITY_DN2371_c1_g2_i6.p1 TRINITY_DN2371_c1_g2~~TRINITY_DN2371_c1_g2_i6.p1  ORF type:complete len:592 (-),score=63.28 TRINITY_DN2371_c1_g2_i6:10-1725(-)
MEGSSAPQSEYSNLFGREPTRVTDSPSRPQKQTVDFIGEISPEQVLRIVNDGGRRCLGIGSFGGVFAGVHLDNEVAVKIMKSNNEEVTESFREEIKTLMQGSCANVIGYRGACMETVRITYTPDKESRTAVVEGMAIIMELATGGTLDLVREKKPSGGLKHQLSLYQRLSLGRDTARGLAWLHCGFSRPIAHRDLASKNVFVTKTADGYKAKLGDLGLAKHIAGDSILDKGQGTFSIRAPELLVLDDEDILQYDHRADYYSLALVLWELLTREIAYRKPRRDYQKLKDLVCEQGYRETIPANTLPRLQRLISMLWSYNPQDRLPKGRNADYIVDELEHVLIETAIEDPAGREFWTQYFFKKQPSLKEFSKALYAYLGLTYPKVAEAPAIAYEVMGSADGTKHESTNENQQELNCLWALMSAGRQPNKNEPVSIVQFGRILNWMGGLKNLYDNRPFPTRIRSLLVEPWFHGTIDSGKAINLLTSSAPGSYLVRFSTEPNTNSELPIPNQFSIMYKNEKGNISKARILRATTGEFQAEGVSSTSSDLVDLVEQVAHKTNLSHPISGSPYSSLF